MVDNQLLFTELKNGDETASSRIVEQNMGLVINSAKRFLNRGYDLEELIQVGAIGLIKAVKGFDDSFGVMFSTYAVPVILGEIRKFLRDDGPIKISRSIKDCAVKGRRCEEELRKKLNREPKLREISEKSGISEEALLEAFDAMEQPRALFFGEEEQCDKIGVSSDENKIVDRLFISSMLEKLEKRERQVIVLRYFRNYTQAQISEIIGVSQVQISRIEKKVLEKMRNHG